MGIRWRMAISFSLTGVPTADTRTKSSGPVYLFRWLRIPRTGSKGSGIETNLFRLLPAFRLNGLSEHPDKLLKTTDSRSSKPGPVALPQSVVSGHFGVDRECCVPTMARLPLQNQP